jgi:hypothetical protein
MRPLIRRAPDGRPYVVPTEPQRPAPEPTRQPTGGTPSVPGRPTPHKPQAGQGLGRAKLTDDEVRGIRRDYAAGKWTRKDLAYIYGVGLAAIGNVLNGRSYSHVTTEPTPREQDS